MAAPIEITRIHVLPEPGAAPWAHVRLRGTSAHHPWLKIRGLNQDAHLTDVAAHFIPRDRLTLTFRHHGRFGYAVITTPGANEIGFDQDHLILFTTDPDGFDETVTVRRISLFAPNALRNSCAGWLDPEWRATMHTDLHQLRR